MQRQMLYYEGSTIASHRPPSIDPGLGQWRGGTENAKAEACQQEDALGKQGGG